ncbi:MAG: pentapeptide repeat-containing protein [Nodosilinea sp.]
MSIEISQSDWEKFQRIVNDVEQTESDDIQTLSDVIAEGIYREYSNDWGEEPPLSWEFQDELMNANQEEYESFRSALKSLPSGEAYLSFFEKDYSGAYLSRLEIKSPGQVHEHSPTGLGQFSLAGKIIENMNFSHANLKNADFTGARFEGVDFSFANLENADFARATFIRCNFKGVDMSVIIRSEMATFQEFVSDSIILKHCEGPELPTVPRTATQEAAAPPSLVGTDLSIIKAEAAQACGGILQQAPPRSGDLPNDTTEGTKDLQDGGDVYNHKLNNQG